MLHICILLGKTLYRAPYGVSRMGQLGLLSCNYLLVIGFCSAKMAMPGQCAAPSGWRRAQIVAPRAEAYSSRGGRVCKWAGME